MPLIALRPGVRRGSCLGTVTAAALALLAAPCLADVAPESGLLAHVEPFSPYPYWPCYTQITSCTEITRSTSAEGSVVFLLFFMRGAYSWPGQTICIRSLETQLTWPETWQLVDYQVCSSWCTWFTLGSQGPVHPLRIEWYPGQEPISELPGGVIPVAYLVMNVAGPGWLDFVSGWGQAELELDCLYGSTFLTYPVQIGAEAGMQCGYVSAHCGYRENACLARFEVPELRLSASLGGAADSTVNFWAYQYYNPELLCSLDVDTHAPWCTAWIDPVYELGRAYLHVAADASGLQPGIYETDIELSNTYWAVASCLPVQLDVGGGSTPVSPATWGRIKALYRWQSGMHSR